jgi:glycosyltransferase involved in cell wall biosynthesis
MFEQCAHAVVVSFEGPDPYSSVGGLATRVCDMVGALGDAGVKSTLMFVGDPEKPQAEQVFANVEYRRCAQSVSARLQSRLYSGEDEKITDLIAKVPRFITQEIVAPAARQGKRTLVITEEWQTAPVAIELDRMLRARNLRSSVALLWNANNTYGFERIAWDELRRAARITTVSKFMKYILHGMNIESLVIPNGVADRLLAGADEEFFRALERALPHRPLFVKVGRFDPDKRWMQAIDAFALVRERLPDARFIIRGGAEAYGAEVLERARARNIGIEEIHFDSCEPYVMTQALAASRAPITVIRSAISESFLRALYRTADAVLANSGKEPFGLVGLEVMASGGVAVCGATGEEYAQPFVNAIVCDTSDPHELAVSLMMLAESDFAQKLRDAGRQTAQRYTWSRILEILDRKLAYIFLENADPAHT